MADNKVLVVEDDANLLETLKYNLRKESYHVVTASDGSSLAEHHLSLTELVDDLLRCVDFPGHLLPPFIYFSLT